MTLVDWNFDDGVKCCAVQMADPYRELPAMQNIQIHSGIQYNITLCVVGVSFDFSSLNLIVLAQHHGREKLANSDSIENRRAAERGEFEQINKIRERLMNDE